MTDNTNPSAEFEIITPEIAEAYLGKNSANRGIRATQVSKLARDIKAGNFLVTGETIKFDWNGIIADGQHRLHAIIAAGIPVTSLVVRGLDPRVRDVIDAQSRRSAADALGFNGLESRKTATAAAVRIIISWEAGKFTTAASRPLDLTNSEIVDWYVTNGAALEDAVKFTSPMVKKIHSWPAPTAAAFYILANIDYADAVEFFSDMENLTLNGPHDPRRTLLARLDAEQGRRSAVSPIAEQMFFFFRTWNAWREGSKLIKLVSVTRSGAVSIPEPK